MDQLAGILKGGRVVRGVPLCCFALACRLLRWMAVLCRFPSGISKPLTTPVLSDETNAQVNVASNYAGDLRLDDLQFTKREYDENTVYRQSKQVPSRFCIIPLDYFLPASRLGALLAFFPRGVLTLFAPADPALSLPVSQLRLHALFAPLRLVQANRMTSWHAASIYKDFTVNACHPGVTTTPVPRLAAFAEFVLATLALNTCCWCAAAEESGHEQRVGHACQGRGHAALPGL